MGERFGESADRSKVHNQFDGEATNVNQIGSVSGNVNYHSQDPAQLTSAVEQALYRRELAKHEAAMRAWRAQQAERERAERERHAAAARARRRAWGRVIAVWSVLAGMGFWALVAIGVPQGWAFSLSLVHLVFGLCWSYSRSR
jgi:hypothetical protein